MPTVSVPCYLAPNSNSSNIAEGPLSPDSPALGVGHGSDDAVPFSYSLPDGKDIDVGYLKLFLTTTWLDMSWISQGYPFVESKRDDEKVREEMLRSNVCDAVTVAVVQRRFNSNKQ